MQKRKVLIAMEESGKISEAFRSKGWLAYSCDLKPTRGDKQYHYQGCIMDVLDENNKFDLIIAHPDCTKLAVSGNRWYGKGTKGHQQRLDSIEWTCRFWDKVCECSDHSALENPVSVIFQYLDNVDCLQYVQPWQFGHGETKKTGFALRGLPELVPTNIVEGRADRIHKMPPSADRKQKRSETYQGIADAIADQWSKFIEVIK